MANRFTKAGVVVAVAGAFLVAGATSASAAKSDRGDRAERAQTTYSSPSQGAQVVDGYDWAPAGTQEIGY